ncbi:LysE/ArgO family amino acid transporter [Polaromonas hydrogenivorans]|uniref:LysE family transporter n=1 Tax=Polaromonas hydrogenivorans TaxID=335476 RepID=A0AAU7LSU8_9BURK
MNLFTAPAFFAGLALSLSLIMAIGPQNAHVMRMGLRREHLWLTVAICVVTDVSLIAVGVGGLAQLGGLSGKLLGALTGAGAVLLFMYGAQAMQRFVRPAPLAVPGAGPEAAPGMSRRRAIGLAVAMSWLNPHAWLDTAVLMGTASLAYARPDNAVFGLGAAAGSLLWFSALGLAMWSLGSRLNAPWVWRALDGLVALMMWGTGAWLLAGLV